MFHKRSFDSFLLVCLAMADIMQRHKEKYCAMHVTENRIDPLLHAFCFFSLSVFFICNSQINPRIFL